MKQWDIVSWQPPGWPEPHPAVIVSHAQRAVSKPDVEVVLCSTQRAGRKAASHEFMLDEADGLDWPTLCKCDLIYAVNRQALGRKRGQVSDQRKGPLARTLLAAHGWAEFM